MDCRIGSWIIRSYIIWEKKNWYCGAKGSGDSGPFDIKPKVHDEEEEMPEDEWTKSRPPNFTAEDDPLLGRPKSWERNVPRHPRQSTRGSQKRFQAIWASHRGMGERQPRRSRHLRIKYPQLTPWPHWCGCDPWTGQWGLQQLKER